MWWQIGLFLVSLALAYLFRPKPETNKPPPVDDFDISTADNGSTINVLFGTRLIKNHNVVWWGDSGSREFKVSGGESTWLVDIEDVHGGYYYFVSLHSALCIGPIDYLHEIVVDEKTVWTGYHSGGQFWVDAVDVFGGKESGGGVGGKNLAGNYTSGSSNSGSLYLETGETDQAQNTYLQSVLGTDIPAFRGVCCVVAQQLYIGTAPYLKQMSFKCQRIHNSTDGATQWYDAKSAIMPTCGIDGTSLAIYIALDYSSSMLDIASNGLTRNANQRAAIKGFLDEIETLLLSGALANVSMQFVGYGTKGTPNVNYPSPIYQDIDSADIATMKSWIDSNGATASTYTYFPAGTEDMGTFFSTVDSLYTRVLFFLTDGSPNSNAAEGPPTDAYRLEITNLAANDIDAISGIASYGINIDLDVIGYTNILANSAGNEDAIPVLDSGDPAELTNILLGYIGFVRGNDMNPAHIIRECLTDTNWGMGYSSDDIDSTSFTAAADTLYDEELGISLEWTQQSSLWDFVGIIKKHIDAELYVSRSTGKFELHLIRNDYDPDSLTVLNEDNIASVESVSRPALGELVNSVTVIYYDACIKKDASITVTDQALIGLQGGEINTTNQYPGITTHENAAKIATRDLRALSSPLLSAVIYANRDAEDFYPGDVFIFDWPDLGIDRVICRVKEIDLGDGLSNTVRLSVVEDVFSLPETVVTIPDDDDPAWVNPVQAPEAVTYQIAGEMPYHALMRVMGKTDIDSIIDSDDDAGFVYAAAVRPGNAINAEMHCDSGSGYEQEDTLQFCGSCLLTAAVDQTDTAWTWDGGTDMGLVAVGMWGQIEDEIVAVSAIDTDAGTMTVLRGVMDTEPRTHADDSRVYFWNGYRGYDKTRYQDADSVNVKILPRTGSGILSISDASAETVVLDERADRPYPPGDLQIDGTPYPNPAIINTSSFDVTWEHRDRLTQTALLDHTDTSVSTAEAGTTYTVRVYDDNPTLQIEHTGIGGKTQTVDMSGEATGDYTLQVWSVRDSKYSFQCAEWDFYFVLPVTGTGAGSLQKITGSGSGTFTASGTGAGSLQKITGSGSVTPLIYDSFTDSNSTALGSHTPDVDTEGTGWESVTNFEINSNELQQATATSPSYAAIDSGVTSKFCNVHGTTSYNNGSNYSTQNLIIRHQNTTNYSRISINPYTGLMSIDEIISSTLYTRASTAVSEIYRTDNVTWKLRCESDGSSISGFIHVGSSFYSVNYSTSTFGTETYVGLQFRVVGTALIEGLDNFGVYEL